MHRLKPVLQVALLLLLPLSLLGQTTVLLPMPRQCFLDNLNQGKPLAGGLIYSCVAGTSCPGNPQATFTDATGGTQNTNPVTLDAAGCASMWLTQGVAYKFVAQNSSGVQEWSADRVSGLASSLSTSVAASTTVSFSATPTFTALAEHQLFKMALTGNVTSSSLVMTGLTAPALVTFELTQDGTGGRTFVFPSTVTGGTPPLPGPNTTTVQHFVWDGTTAYPISEPLPVVLPGFAGGFAAALTSCGSAPCTLDIVGPITVSASAVIPANILTRFDGGSFSIAGGQTLTINGPIQAAAVPLFAGTGLVAGLSQARPEWFAASLTYPMAASAVLAAYNSLGPISGGSADLLLLNQAYISPWPSSLMTKSNIRTLGAGKPIVKPDYSGLVAGSGTIIYGQWPTDTSHGASHIEYRDFGVDVSPTAVTTYFAGTQMNAITMNNNGQVVGSGISEGDIVDHVIGVGYSATAAFHCALFENIDDLKINDLDCFFNTHGIVIKATRYNVSHSVSLGHSGDSFYVKSDTYALAGAGSIHDSQCGGSFNYSTGVTTTDTGVCVFVQGASANTDANDIHDVRGFGFTAGGIVVNTSGTSLTTNTTIANVQIDTVAGAAIQVAGGSGGVFRTNISGVIANNSTNAVSVDSASTQTSIKGVTASNCTGHCFALDGTMTQLYNNQSQGSTGNDYFQTGGTVVFGEANKGVFGRSGGTFIGGVALFTFGATTATAATAGNAATTTYTLPVPFADASYTATCTPNGTITGTPAWQGITAQSATQITVSVIAVTNAASSFGGVNCNLKHNN